MINKNLFIKFIFLLFIFFNFSYISFSKTKTTIENQKTINITSFSYILRYALPSVVNIIVQGSNQHDTTKYNNNYYNNKSYEDMKNKKYINFRNIGSGVIINSKHGLIITNEHVIHNANSIKVTLYDGRELQAKLIGSDEGTDIAVLKIKAKNIHDIMIGNSDYVEVGDFVVAIGNAFALNSIGNSQTVTFGIVSAIKRNNLNIEKFENFIQTDAAINPGNSGGALINYKGELIGINTAIISPHGGNIGIGFAIPINMAIKIVKQLIKFGSIHRGNIGIFIQRLTPELSKAMGYSETLKGAVVTKINKYSSAQKSGIQEGDIITAINDIDIYQATQIKEIVGLLQVGNKIKISILRNGKKLLIYSIITDSVKDKKNIIYDNPFLWNVTISNYEQNSPIYGHIFGVKIINVPNNSNEWKFGIRNGDVIISINNQFIKNIQEFNDIIEKQKKNKELLIKVIRGIESIYLVLPKESY